MDMLPKKILVVFSNIDTTHRLMLAGILRYVREKCTPAWQVQLDLRDISRRNPSEIVSGGFAGIVAAVMNPADRRKYLRTGLPTVLYEPTFGRMEGERRPDNNVTFFNDHAAEGRAAAEYFLERGFRSFAYVGTALPAAWSTERRAGYAARLRKAGIRPMVYPGPGPAESADFTRETPAMARWLRRLPRSTALFAAHDLRARQVEIAAQMSGVRIPDDIALLGVDDDTLICETASPPISSIQVHAEETGWRFAEAMHSLLMERRTTPVVRTCHTQVKTRQSTSAFAFNDPVVVKAVAYAEANLSGPLPLHRLAQAANCSVRTLQMKMMHVLGRTVRDEVSFLRCHEAVKMLRETSDPVAEIADKCGYCSASHLGTHIKRATGMSPLEVRKSAANERVAVAVS